MENQSPFFDLIVYLNDIIVLFIRYIVLFLYYLHNMFIFACMTYVEKTIY